MFAFIIAQAAVNVTGVGPQVEGVVTPGSGTPIRPAASGRTVRVYTEGPVAQGTVNVTWPDAFVVAGVEEKTPAVGPPVMFTVSPTTLFAGK
jgi:hypothetical protein